MTALPHAGMLVHQDVRLLRPLSAGGMGSVWVAEHRKLRGEVAVKLMASKLADDPAARARFEREATTASRVRSSHVVQILDFGVSTDGHPFIVMELLEGKDLRARLHEHGALPVGEALSVAGQLCHAIERAHTRGIVHRDLKPSNVFLCDSPRQTLVKLLDFGIAKEAGAEGVLSTTAAAGTPLYMSPEQLAGDEAIDFRTDLWALGVIVFEMLTGKRPFEGATQGALALAIHTLPFPSACEVAPTLPRGVDGWLARACARSPAARFESAAQAARELERAFDHPATAFSPRTLPPVPGITTQTDPAKPPARLAWHRVTTSLTPLARSVRAGVSVAAIASAATLVGVLAFRERATGRVPASLSPSTPSAVSPAPAVEPVVEAVVAPAAKDSPAPSAVALGSRTSPQPTVPAAVMPREKAKTIAAPRAPQPRAEPERRREEGSPLDNGAPVLDPR